MLELLAPAGNFEKLKYALAYGADAVYAGHPTFSLRARENGFQSAEHIREGIEYCHAHGKKFYLTSNIIPHNNKINAFQKSLDEFIALKPDALIMTDPGMIHYVREKHPDQEIHLSVQANCTNWTNAKFWHSIGVKRIILSRELRLREVEEIKQKVPELELEVFVHGAICMAYSGRCLLSNYMSFRDSNQGMCSNACRFKYSIYAKNEPQSEEYIPLEGEFFLKELENQSSEDGLIPIDEDQYGTYIMNSKDMCAIEHLDKLRDAGVVSFKVEGRTKSIYYLSRVMKSYRSAINDLEAGRPFNMENLESVLKTESRGYFPGFFVPSKASSQNYETTRQNSKTGSVAGLVRDFDVDIKEALVDIKGQIKEGEILEIMTPKETLDVTAVSLKNHKNKPKEKLDSGLTGCKIQLDKEIDLPAFMVTKIADKAENVSKSDAVVINAEDLPLEDAKV